MKKILYKLSNTFNNVQLIPIQFKTIAYIQRYVMWYISSWSKEVVILYAATVATPQAQQLSLSFLHLNSNQWNHFSSIWMHSSQELSHSSGNVVLSSFCHQLISILATEKPKLDSVSLSGAGGAYHVPKSHFDEQLRLRIQRRANHWQINDRRSGPRCQPCDHSWPVKSTSHHCHATCDIVPQCHSVPCPAAWLWGLPRKVA